MASETMAIESIHVGKPENHVYGNTAILTGINKRQVNEPVFLHRLNFEGDGQADLENHGGSDKAVCVYCHEHYSYWERALGRRLGYSAFGENLTVRGMLEQDVYIGDIFRIGKAVVQISQPRQPCHKLAKKHDIPDLPLYIQQTGFTGYYFRVLEEGEIAPHAAIELVQKHPLGVTVAFANKIKYHQKNDSEGIGRILAVDALSESWNDSFAKRLSELK